MASGQTSLTNVVLKRIPEKWYVEFSDVVSKVNFNLLIKEINLMFASRKSWFFKTSHNAVLPLCQQVAFFATPELWLTSLICGHVVVSSQAQTENFTPCPWSPLTSRMTHYTTSKKCEATVYHWLYWDNLIARFWWILWEADLLIAVLSQALNAQNVTGPFVRTPLNTHLRLRSCKCFSFRAPEWLWDNNQLNIWWRLGYITWLNLWGLLCWQRPCEAVKDSMHPSQRKSRVGQSSGEEEEGRGRGHLTDGLSEWIIDRGLLTDAASINSSKPLWWITADKQAH